MIDTGSILDGYKNIVSSVTFGSEVMDTEKMESFNIQGSSFSGAQEYSFQELSPEFAIPCTLPGAESDTDFNDLSVFNDGPTIGTIGDVAVADCFW